MDGTEQANSANFFDGAILILLNPKAYVIIALMFSQFLKEASSTAEVIANSVSFTLNNLVAFTLWTVVGDWLHWRCDLSLSAAREKVRIALIVWTRPAESTSVARSQRFEGHKPRA